MKSKTFLSLSLISLFVPLVFLFFSPTTQGAVTLDHQIGLWADDFANNSGVPTRSYVNANTSQGVLQLTNTSSQTSFALPYRASGNALTTAIRPLLAAKWGMLAVDATIPEGTTLKVQVMDRSNILWPDYILPGNSEGIDISETSEIDLSVMPYLNYCEDMYTSCSDSRSIRIKILMTTEDTSITPTVDNLSFTWIPRQGTFQETVSLSEEDPWPVSGYSIMGNQQNTRSTPYSNPQTYPAFRWMSDRISRNPYMTNLFARKDAIIAHAEYGKLVSFNRDTGEENWKIPAGYLGGGFIDANGIYYSDNMNVDYSQAIDTNTGEVKWVYFSGSHGAHGGANVALGSNGKLYYTRDSASSVNTVLVEQSPDGTVESTTVFNVVPEGFSSGESKYVGSLLIGPDGRGYVMSSVSKSGTVVLEKGGIWAIDLEEKTIEQIYSGSIRSNFVIGKDGTIYGIPSVQMSGSFDGTTFRVEYLPSPLKIFALHPDGTIKWERNAGVFAEPGYQHILLREDGNLLAIRDISDGMTYGTATSEILDGETGEVLSIKDAGYGEQPHFIDGQGGMYAQYSYTYECVQGECVEFDIVEENLRYTDTNNVRKWQISYLYNLKSEDKRTQFFLSPAVPDERGWVYAGLRKNVVNSTTWTQLMDESFVKVFALAPWTLTDLTDISGNRQAGDTVNFTVKTSMQETNPVFEGDNAMQVVMENGDKVLLSYASTDENGDTLWTGSYTLPADFDPSGTGNYTIEASQSYLQTDIETHFDLPPTESNNTGITLSGSFSVTKQVTEESQTTEEFNTTPPSTKGEKILLDTTPINFKKTTHIQTDRPVFKGKNVDAKNGSLSLYTKTKKGGTKKLITVPVNEKGEWKHKLKRSTGKDQYALQFTDASGNTSDISSFFTIYRDATDPKLTLSPDTADIQLRTQPITFEAEDEDSGISHYKTQLYNEQGKVVRSWRTQQSSENYYYLPEALEDGTYTLYVRVFDKTGNSIQKEVTRTFVETLPLSQEEVNQQSSLSTEETKASTEEERQKKESLPEDSITQEESTQIQESSLSEEEQDLSKNIQEEYIILPKKKVFLWWNPFTWF